jgi:hypothetical protein
VLGEYRIGCKAVQRDHIHTAIILRNWPLDYSILVYLKSPDAFIRMPLLNSSETLSGILRGKRSSQVYSNILGLFKINIYDNPLETELDLIFRNLSALVIIQNEAMNFDTISGGRCASLQLVQCSQQTAVANYWKIMPLNYTVRERYDKHYEIGTKNVNRSFNTLLLRCIINLYITCRNLVGTSQNALSYVVTLRLV